MSYLEFIGTVLSLLSVYLVSRNNIWTWPVGNAGVILFGILFYQIRLYADLIEQMYFLITGFYGWWVWAKYKSNSDMNSEASIRIDYSSQKTIYMYLAVILAGTLGLGFFIKHLHEFLPGFFSEPASYPFLDSFTTILSFSATILMIYKKIECWYLWITVDILGIGLYYVKGIVFVAILYLIFLFLATKGLLNWKAIRSQTGAAA